MMMKGAMQDVELTLDGFITHAAKWHPRTEVVTACADGTTRRAGYADVAERSARLSAGLTAIGVGPGDVVATLAWNSQDHVETWFAAVGIGAIVHTLNPRLKAGQLSAMLVQSQAAVLAVSADLIPLAAEIACAAPLIRDVIFLDGPAPPQPARMPGLVVHDVGALLAAHPLPATWGGFDERTPAGLCFTSGTTGAPKGVLYTHRSNYLITLRMLQADVLGISAHDAMLVVVPMFHANGWGLPFAAPAAGAKLVLPGRHTDGASLARLIREENVTVAAGVPTVWLSLADHLDATGEDLPSLQRILMGGAPVPPALMERIETRLGATVQTSWGMTELSPVGTVSPPGAATRSASTSGRPSVGIDLLLKDAEGVPLPDQRDGEGHLFVRGGSVVQRYFGMDEDATDGAGWFDTGDLARIGPDGDLTITGRAKDLIKSGGEWINPAEIEAIVGEAPEVAQAAVIARQHPKWGERPILIVEMRDGQSIADDDLIGRLRGKVAQWWLPDAVVRLPTMPLAATGKIDKQRLRSEYGEMA
jgi:acyl-CoA synthetase (AMP-forming)/AMP-acid ligase II